VKVLIADDSEVVVSRLIRMFAEIKGVEIADQAGTVPEASTAVDRLRPDVVILDLQMPGGSGLDVLKSMQRNSVKSTVIVLTNHAFPQYRKKCLQSGAHFFLDKSTEFEKVGELLKRLIDSASENTGSASRAGET
jgi:DNA-binding NarL/FixJ family response regulator